MVCNTLAVSYLNLNIIRVCCLFLSTSLGLLEPYTHGTLWTASVQIYTITSAVAGYTAASYHCQFSETGWVSEIILSALYLEHICLRLFYYCVLNLGMVMG